MSTPTPMTPAARGWDGITITNTQHVRVRPADDGRGVILWARDGAAEVQVPLSASAAAGVLEALADTLADL